MKKLGLFTFLLAICLSWAQAQVYYITVSGTVTDINGGAPVANHLVDVAIDSSNFFGYSYFTTVTTDALGQYSAVVPVVIGLNQGTGYTGTRDCTPGGYSVVNYTFTNNTTTIPNLNHQICTTVQNNCNSAFSATWIQGSTNVQFADQSTASTGNITAWSWNFGDGGTSSLQNPSHSYNAMGSYVVCLDITTSTGCTDTYCDSVYVGNNTGIFCNATLTPNVNPGGSVTYSVTASGSGTIIGYSYDFGDGSPILGSANASETHTYAVSGTYIACVDVIFSDSCIARSCATVTTTGALGCQAGFFWYPDSSGNYSIIVVNTSAGNNLSYQWTFGDGSSSTQAYPQHTYSGPGTFVVCVTVTSNNPQCTDTYCDSLVVVNKVATPFTINVIANGATSVNPNQNAAANVSIYPNPARDFLQVDVTLTDNSNVGIALMDISGRVVATENVGELNSGKHGIRLQTQDLPAGLYLARVTTNNGQSTHKVMIAH
jgi:PKD repeat protein